MNIHNTSPFSFGGFVTIDSDAKYKSTVFIKASFHLAPEVLGRPLDDQPFPQGDVSRQDAGLAGESLAYASDFVPWKPRADVLFVGSAYRPDRHPRDHYRIGLRVGDLSKQLVVSAAGHDAECVPVSYENSYGGDGFEYNPVGVGHDQTGTPRIQFPDQAKRTWRNSSPASFGPIPAQWEPRKSKFGKYKGDAEQRWPGLPRDFDGSYFNSAPPDQQVDGYLVGNEEVVLQNLVQGHPLFSTRLPGIRMVSIRENLEKHCTIVPMNLDTLWIDGDQMRVVLIWRGQMSIETPECPDIKRLGFIAAQVDSPWKDASHYRDQIDAVLGPRDEGIEAERPDLEAEVEPTAPGTRATGDKEAEDLQADKLNAEIAAVKQCLGIEEPETPANPKPLSLTEMPPLPPDLQCKLDAAMAEMDKQDQESEAREAERRWTREKVIDAVNEQRSLDGIDLSGIDLSNCGLAGSDFRGATMKAADFRGSDLERARFDGCVLEGANFDGARLEASRFDSANLSGSRFVGADLRQAVLDGADCSDALLENCDLSGSQCESTLFDRATIRGVNWAGARLSKAGFGHTRVENSDFRKSVLADAGLGSSHLMNIKLDDADISHADFGAATIQDATFDRVTAEGTDFTEANLTRTSFKSARCKGTWFSGATLERADFQGASCHAMQLDGTVARQANFTSADITGLRGGERADLSGACFRHAYGAAPVFESCVLDEADFSSADIEGANFIKASLNRATLIAAEMKSSRFDYATCRQTSFDHANLFESGFADADLTDADFTGANVYASEFLNAKLDGTVLRDANTKMTELKSWLRT